MLPVLCNRTAPFPVDTQLSAADLMVDVCDGAPAAISSAVTPFSSRSPTRRPHARRRPRGLPCAACRRGRSRGSPELPSNRDQPSVCSLLASDHRTTAIGEGRAASSVNR